jgi:putative pyruvate formate lyase activating enzyme
LSHCVLCPRECGVNRFCGPLGFCNSDAGFHISSICNHKGEEPVISGTKGICNIFFPHCNLQCIYCQNHEISSNKEISKRSHQSFDDIIACICETLEYTENILGFVSPSHYIPQMMTIIRGLHNAGKYPVFVYNTNSYDKVKTLQSLEGIIDIYLADYKYADNEKALAYSQARDYPRVAKDAISEMYRQKGSGLIINDDGLAQSGVIVRHLILPGEIDSSIASLKCIAEISNKFHISLMSQYFPTDLVKNHPVLYRTITPEEYQKVVDAFYDLGFYRGWIQDTDSHSSLRPDFSKDEPFGK